MAFGYVKGRALAALSEELGKGKFDYAEHKKEEASKAALIQNIAGNIGEMGIDALTTYSTKQENIISDSGVLSEKFTYGDTEYDIYDRNEGYGAFRSASGRIQHGEEFSKMMQTDPLF